MPENEAKFTTSTVGATTVVRLNGPRITDQVYINELGDELVLLLEQSQTHDLLLDLEEVELLSSSMLGKLIRLLKRTRQAKGRLRLCAIRPSIHEVFEIYPDANEALASRR